MTRFSLRDLSLARKAKQYGARYSLRIILEARRAGIPISLGFALIECESGFRNVFGHDPTRSIPESWKGGEVTRERYRYYKSRRARYGMQGVGPAQLTWYAYQDRADRLGGCYIPRHNIRVAFEHLAGLIEKHGRWTGVARYNGSGPAAEKYAVKVRERFNVWHRRLA